MNPATQYRQDSRLALFAYSPPFSLPPFSLPPLSLPPLPLCHPHYLADDDHTHEDQHLVLDCRFPVDVRPSTNFAHKTAEKPCKDTLFMRTSSPRKAQPDRLHHILVTGLTLKAKEVILHFCLPVGGFQML
ncbi:hypothetical protein IAS59_005199 [Cryptococcus gattii]